MVSPDSGSRKRALLETMDSGDGALADKYGRADDIVAKASMDELTGSWLVNENGEIDEDTATGTLMADCLAGGGLHWTSRPRSRPRRKRWTVFLRTE